MATSESRTTRLTIDLDGELHRSLKRFALDQADNTTLADLIRAAARLIARDEDFANKVALEVYRKA